MLSGLAAGDAGGTGITRGVGDFGRPGVGDPGGTCSIAQGLALASQTTLCSVNGWQESDFVMATRHAAKRGPDRPAALVQAAIASFWPSATVGATCGPLETTSLHIRTAAWDVPPTAAQATAPMSMACLRTMPTLSGILTQAHDSARGRCPSCRAPSRTRIDRLCARGDLRAACVLPSRSP